VEDITGNEILYDITDVEPIGPQRLLDVLVIAPATGNTVAKLAAGISDTSVTMAAKAHLRNGRPIVVAVASNDGLSAGARNIGELLNRKNYYFVPFGQDNAKQKPNSLIADFNRIPETVDAALKGEQIQPILLR
jgi:dipicolinate synthase subunit B